MSFSKRGANATLLGLALCLTFAFSLAPRVEAYRQWKATPERYFDQGIPALGPDSYFFLRMARLSAAPDVPERDSLRRHPDGVSPVEIPALSRAIGLLARITGSDVYSAGLQLGVLLSSLFTIPLLITCWRLSLPAAGVLGALVGSLSPAFVYRSSLRDVDTDGGNLFFVWLLAALLVHVREDAQGRGPEWTSAAAGLALATFVAWYDLAAFQLVYLAVFALHLWATGFERARAMRLFALFTLCSNPLTLATGFGNLVSMLDLYFLTGATASAGGLAFPNAYAEIEELIRHGPVRTLEGLLGNPWLAGAGLALCGGLFVKRWRHCVPLLPIVVIGLLAFLRAFRFAMYLAPFVGIGLGAILGLSVRRALAWRGLPPRGPTALAAELGLASAVTIALVASSLTAYGVQARNWIEPRHLAGVRETARALGDAGAILAPWHLGYMLSDVARLPSFDDGMAPSSPLQHLLARALTSTDPAALSELTGFLKARGHEGLAAAARDARDHADFLAQVRRGATPFEAPVALLIHDRALREYHGLLTTGQWDFEQGTAPVDGYDLRECRTRSATLLVCTKAGAPALAVDLAAGTVAGRAVLRRVVFIEAGRVLREQSFARDEGATLQIVRLGDSAVYQGQFVSESIHQSVLNQLFMLGRTPPDFELLVDAWPAVRSFRIPSP